MNDIGTEPRESTDGTERRDDGPPKFPLSPWLVVLGIVALLVGLVLGLIMASVGA